MLRSFDVVVEVLGWDEAFLGADTADPELLAGRSRPPCWPRPRLHCSIGIGDNTLRAKIATEFGKPAGMFRLTASNWEAVMFDRPTRALWGIGAKTARKLDELGLRTVASWPAADPAVVAARLGPSIGPWMVQLALGNGRRTVIGTPWVPRSHSRETTYQQNLMDWAEVRRELGGLTERVYRDVLADGRPVGRVAVKVRFAPFFTSTRSETLKAPTVEPVALERRRSTSRALRPPPRGAAAGGHGRSSAEGLETSRHRLARGRQTISSRHSAIRPSTTMHARSATGDSRRP